MSLRYQFASLGMTLLMLGLVACTQERAAEPMSALPTEETEAISQPTAAPVTLSIFAAASLADAFREIGEGFAAEHPGVTPEFNFAGSQDLATQINEGAPADVFASANKRQVDAVIQAGRIVSGTQRTFARNHLVVVYPRANEAGVRALADLANPGVMVVLAAKAVPVGAYAQEFLRKASAQPEFTSAYSPTVMANVVSFEDDVTGVLAKVAADEADAGVVYTSDLSGALAEKLGSIPIPDEINVIASYPIAPLADSPHADLARAFVDYVRSPKGQEVLVKHGFLPSTGDASGAVPWPEPVSATGWVAQAIALTTGEN